MNESTKCVNRYYAMEYYLAIKRDAVLIPAPAWMNLETTVLSGRSQIQKLQRFDLYEISRIAKFMPTESRLMVTGEKDMEND